MPSPAPPLQLVQTPRHLRLRRSISLRAPLQTDGPTPPSLLHSPLLNATTRGPAIYPTNSPSVSQPSSRRPSESASSVSSSSRASSQISVLLSTSAASIPYSIPGTISPHVQRSRFTSSAESHPPSSFHHTHTGASSWPSPAVSSAAHLGEFHDDPWRILDTVPVSPHRGSSHTPTPTPSTPLSARAATTTVPSGTRAQHTHVPPPPVSHHARIGPYAPPEFWSHQQSQTPTRRLGAGTTVVVSIGVGNNTVQDPASIPVLRSMPHSPL